MIAVPFPFFTKTRALVLAIIGPMALQPATAAPEPPLDLPVFQPRSDDYTATCKTDDGDNFDLGRNWVVWNGIDTDRSTGDLIEIASEYFDGSDRVSRDVPTASRVAEYIEANRDDQDPIDFNLLKARIAIRLSATDRLGPGSEQALIAAFEAGSTRAAEILGEYYGLAGPEDIRDQERGKRYLEIAAAAGDPAAQISLVDLLISMKAISRDQQRQRLTGALTGMVAAVESGRCSYAKALGRFYLDGEYAGIEEDAGLSWLQIHAGTDNGSTSVFLARRLLRGRPGKAEIAQAMQYFEQASARGNREALFEIGRAHAVGLVPDRDLQLAETNFLTASQAGVEKAGQWLARLYRGEFGGTSQPKRAVEVYETALETNPDDEAALLGYGNLLAEIPALEKNVRAVDLFEKAALKGSARAARYAGDIYIHRPRADDGTGIRPEDIVPDSAPGDPPHEEAADSLRKAVQYYRLGAKGGDATAARRLSELYACGQGVDYSLPDSQTWLEKSAALGSAQSLYEIASTVIAGGSRSAQGRGLELMEEAAEFGSVDAIADLYILHRSGDDAPTNPTGTDGDFFERYEKGDREAVAFEIAERRMEASKTSPEREAAIEDLEAQVGANNSRLLYVKARTLRNWSNSGPDELREAFRDAALAGSIEGMREYGLLLIRNTSTGERQGVEWLEKARDAGDVEARILLAARALPQDILRLDAIAETGVVCSPDLMVSLANGYHDMGAPGSDERAETWLEQAALIGGREAKVLMKVGSAYWRGVAGEDARFKAEPFFEAGFERGLNTGAYRLAEGHFRKVWPEASPETGKQMLDELIDLGDQRAARELGKQIARGDAPGTYADIDRIEGLMDDTFSIVPYYTRLARQSEEGKLGPTDADLTLEWLEKAAETGGDRTAIRRVAESYLYGGFGRPRDPREGMAWLKKAAEAGDAGAAAEIAAAYELGFVFEKDPEQAKAWSERARKMENSDL